MLVLDSYQHQGEWCWYELFLTGDEQMLIEKEIISPGTYFYTDEATGLPRKLDVSPELTKYWYEQGGKMLAAGLTIPVPCEHDFNSHPMTPADRLKGNAGWVKEFRLRENKLFGVCDIQDEDIARKLPRTIRWTSPWINSFTDGQGKKWDNVISHLALTTRPRITKQAPFSSIAAAMSLATTVRVADAASAGGGFCLSKAGRLAVRKRDKKLCPRYPIAFSLFSGAALAEGDMPMPRKKKPDGMKEAAPPEEEFEDEIGDEGVEGVEMDADPTNDSTVDLEPFNDPAGDVKMEELLCDLLSALGIHCEKSQNEDEFKRSLYNAAMSKIHELTAKGQAASDPGATDPMNPTTSPAGNNGVNPLIQQEQQPMYMSLQDIHKITDSTMRTIALSMYNENLKLRAEVDASAKTANSLRDAKLKEASLQRASRVTMLSRLSPRVKTDLDAMLSLPSMALSMGDGGAVVDPMAQTLAVLEKGLADMPRLLTTEASALAMQPHPTDGDALTSERADAIADSFSRMMGCPPERKVG